MLAAAWSTWVLVVAVLVCSPGRDVAVSAVPVPNPDPEIRAKRYVVQVPAAAVNLTGVSLRRVTSGGGHQFRNAV